MTDSYLTVSSQLVPWPIRTQVNPYPGTPLVPTMEKSTLIWKHFKKLLWYMKKSMMNCVWIYIKYVHCCSIFGFHVCTLYFRLFLIIRVSVCQPDNCQYSYIFISRLFTLIKYSQQYSWNLNKHFFQNSISANFQPWQVSLRLVVNMQFWHYIRRQQN